jgi:hypothetical protein
VIFVVAHIQVAVKVVFVDDLARQIPLHVNLFVHFFIGLAVAVIGQLLLLSRLLCSETEKVSCLFEEGFFLGDRS